MRSISSAIRRQNIALILIGIAFSSLGYYLLLRSDFIDTQPREASSQSGLIYPLPSRGSTYFLSAAQSTELGLLKYTFAASFLLGVLLTRQATQTVRLVISALSIVSAGTTPYSSKTLKRSPGKDPTEFNGSPALFFGSATLSFAVFWLSISPAASALVHRGIILPP